MKLGKYDVLDEIGRGGMGVVYRGFDPVLQRTVAIKTIQQSDSSEIATRLLNEARAAARLQHPNIVEIYDFGQEDETVYIVMELLEGDNLRGALKKGQLSSRALLNLLAEVASALDFGHSRGVVHRDVKPSNIIVLPNGHPKVMDFGVAQLQRNQRLTATGSTLGTPQYMAPEQIRGEVVDGRADEFGLAAIAYEALTGHTAFEADSFSAVMYRIISGDLKDATTLNPQLPEGVNAVLRRGLATDAAARYPTCAELTAALDSAIGMTDLPGFAAVAAPAPAFDQRARLEVVPPRAPSPPPPPFPQPFPPFAQPSPPFAPAPLPPPAPALPSVTILANAAPPSFVDAFPKTGFFSGDQVRFTKIEESFRFFRDNLQKQYESLSNQADVTWKLWAACVGIGFLVLATGLVIMFLSNGEGAVTKGVVTAAASVLVYYIQRLFQQREDHYRRAAEEKNSHLEYGNKWLLVIQTVDAIQDAGERKRQQARIAEALTAQLASGRVKNTTRAKGVRKRTPNNAAS